MGGNLEMGVVTYFLRSLEGDSLINKLIFKLINNFEIAQMMANNQE
jgi:hypothetical protein